MHHSSHVAIRSNVLATSYDYTKPADIAKKNKPVWILPKTNVGWVKGGVDKAKGDWHSGEYVGTIIEPGHWATLEEAELSGQPYIIAGETRSILPEPGDNQHAASFPKNRQITPSSELDTTTLQERLKQIENPFSAKTSKPELNAASSTNIPLSIPGLDHPKIETPPATKSQSSQSLYHPSYKALPASEDAITPPPLSFPNLDSKTQQKEILNQSNPNDKIGLNAPIRYNAQTGELLIRPFDNQSHYIANTLQGVIRVKYLNNGYVEVSRDNQIAQLQFKNPKETIHVRLTHDAVINSKIAAR